MAKTSSSFDSMATAHLKCRSFRHPWGDPVQTELAVDDAGTEWIVMHFVCPWCGTGKDTWQHRATGDRYHKYHHPDGYLIKKVEDWGGRLTFNRNVNMTLGERLLGGG